MQSTHAKCDVCDQPIVMSSSEVLIIIFCKSFNLWNINYTSDNKETEGFCKTSLPSLYHSITACKERKKYEMYDTRHPYLSLKI